MKSGVSGLSGSSLARIATAVGSRLAYECLNNQGKMCAANQLVKKVVKVVQRAFEFLHIPIDTVNAKNQPF